MNIIEKIKEKLEKQISSFTKITVIDESHHHQSHHQGSRRETTHVRIEIISKIFTEMPQLARHRFVQKIIEEELQQIKAFRLSIQHSENKKG